MTQQSGEHRSLHGEPTHRHRTPRVVFSRGVVLVAMIWSLLGTAATGCRRARLPARPDGASVVLAPSEPPAEPNVTFGAESEPNDTLANAQRLELPASGGVGVTAQLSLAGAAKKKDVDLYRLIVPPPVVVEAGPDGAAPVSARRRLIVEARPDAELAVAIDALDEQGKPLVMSAGSPQGTPDGIPNLSVIAGTYFVRVRAAPPTTANAGAGGAAGKVPVNSERDAAATSGTIGGAYRLVVRLMTLEPGEEIEPNGKAALATEIALGSDVTGYLGWRRDEDWFRFPLAGLAEGGVLSVDLDPVEDVAASLLVFDSVEHRLTEQRGRRGERVALRDIRLPTSEPHMFVVVRADSGRSFEAPYALRIRTEQAKADAEMEPNDDAAHALPLADGTVLGHLAPGDVDVYRYAAAAPVELDVEATPPERVDIRIEVIRPDGSTIARADSGKRREAERLPNLYVGGGNVLLRLSAGKGDGNLDEPYRLSVSSRPPEPGAEREPNASPTSATPLSIGETASGLLYPKGDSDNWTLNVPAGSTVSLSARAPAGLAAEVRVQTTAGKELARFRATAEGAEPATRVSPGAEPCCLVTVREATGRAANPRDRYQLTVSQ